MDIEKHRDLWAKIAKDNGWYYEPFFVQVWIDPETNEIYDSVSTRGFTQDHIIYEPEEEED